MIEQILSIPIGWKTKSEKRHYKKLAKRMERFLIRTIKQVEKAKRDRKAI